ncbi:FHA domain-containing protein [Aquimarina aquimarini]|uniref:FHA domain-containing protein n=1 Tax=Aquimarina aquimarini TaxID=1191734 RepID=UPI000D54C017|nr:FHA domain-containing protein [Aquimarina aquimarini]
MAIIKNNLLGKSIMLNVQHTFGRNKYNVCTYIPDNDVSSSHATIFWKNDCWFIHDHSRNGTLINGKQVVHTTIPLNEGDTIQYGQNQTTKWKFIDSDIPTGYLQSVADKDKTLTLPFTDDVFISNDTEMTFYCTKERQWKAEKGGKTIDLIHGVTLYLNNEKWVFIENSKIDETLDYGFIIDQAYFLITLSADEEHIQISIIINELELNLGERVHNYLVLALVRKKIEDITLGRSDKDKGWFSIEELCANISKEFNKEVDEYALNVQVCRLRQQLVKLEPYGYLFSDIIERRSKEIRFAHPYFRIQKEEKLISEVLANTVQ